PRDKRYWLLGYLVGFRAKYWIRRGPINRAWILYTSPPHHIFFYIPVIILLKKKERLELTIELNRRLGFSGEAHLVDPRDRASRKTLARDLRSRGGLSKFADTSYRYMERFYDIYIKGDPKVLDLAKRILNSLPESIHVTRVSVLPREGVVHTAFIVDGVSLGIVREAIESVVRLIREVVRDHEG
ncbi:MAG: hypothetical protein F7B95_03575, partial [Desulfurococcales archaeon]|nr:hypothetical protein [Desulfurococcales archaeon]